MMNEWTCHACGHDHYKKLADLVGKDGNSYQAVRCRKCGLVASHPIPRLDADTLQKIYSADYYEQGWQDGGQGYFAPEKLALMQKEASDQRREIERLTGITSGRILDIGCSDGRYLEEFQNHGWQVAGIEISQYTASQASERLGVNIHTQPLEELNLQPESFDIVRMKHCIEHLPDPGGLLQQVARVLKSGGYVVIDTDNAEGLRTQVENTIRNLFGPSLTRALVKKITGKNLDTKYGRLSPPIHLYTFSRSTLGLLLEKAGLEETHCLRPPHGHPVWFPQLDRYRCNWLEACFRRIDDLGGKLDRGEALVMLARKK